MAVRTASRVSLTRDEIMRTALRIARREGLPAASARRLALELGVTPMALYRHVDGMDGVAAGVIDALLADEGLPAATDDDWRAWLEEIARGLRRLLTAQPAALDLFTRRPVATPAACRRLAATVEFLVHAGFAPDQARQAYAAVHTYTLGFCVLAAARAEAHRPYSVRTAAPATPAASTGWEVAAIEGLVSDDLFGHGLHALLRGLAPSTGDAPSR